jgi:hypothetical protein
MKMAGRDGGPEEVAIIQFLFTVIAGLVKNILG